MTTVTVNAAQYAQEAASASTFQSQSSFAQKLTVYKVDLALDSLLPEGDWSMTCMCYPKNLSAGVPPVISS